MRNLSPSRHPFIAAAMIAVAGAGLALLAFVLVIVPLLGALVATPGFLVHAWSDYSNGVSQQFQQACEETRGPDCQQYGGQP